MKAFLDDQITCTQYIALIQDVWSYYNHLLDLKMLILGDEKEKFSKIWSDSEYYDFNRDINDQQTQNEFKSEVRKDILVLENLIKSIQ